MDDDVAMVRRRFRVVQHEYAKSVTLVDALRPPCEDCLDGDQLPAQ